MKISREQWKKWTLPSKASYLGLWIGLAGALLGVLGIGLAFWFYLNPPASPPSESDIFVRETNPTEVVLAGVKVLNMMGDPSSSLAVEYHNLSKLTARAFKVRVAFGVEELERFKSRAFDGVDLDTLGIKGESRLELPIVRLPELEKRVGGHICGVGLEPLDLVNRAPESCAGSNTVQSTPLLVATFYETVFNERRSMNRAVWLYHCTTCRSLNREL
ncbi:hypothetical protein [Pseudomonas sp.]|uniref:hypothetical protein n=1 Tax=Pseudomonas sp. TaxID=306 RepID=UPI003D132381